MPRKSVKAAEPTALDRGLQSVAPADMDLIEPSIEELSIEAPARILNTAPASIKRPLALVEGRAYLTTWVSVEDATGDRTVRVTLRDDGKLFAEGSVMGAKPLDELGLRIDIPFTPNPNSTMRGAGVNKYVAGERPSPSEVFSEVCKAVDHFIDFSESFGNQSDMAAMTACYIMSTYAQDACGVSGYVMAQGAKGSGKTHLLDVICKLGLLGETLTIGSTMVSFRNLSACGGVQGIDDWEGVSTMKVSQEMRSLLLAGNRSGSQMAVSDYEGGKRITRYIDIRCPRVFTAINAPDATLASRMIVVPFVRTLDQDKASRDPAVQECWPVDVPALKDALWSFGLQNLPRLRACDQKVPTRITLFGRALEPWRGLLGVALFLDETCGVTGLFNRMCALATTYHAARAEDDSDNRDERILVTALRRLFANAGVDGDGDVEAMYATPTRIAEEMNRVAVYEDVEFAGDAYTNAKKVGHQLDSLKVGSKKRDSKGRRRHITRSDVAVLAQRYGIPSAADPKVDDVDVAHVVRAVPVVSAKVRPVAIAPGETAVGFVNSSMPRHLRGFRSKGRLGVRRSASVA